MTKWEYKIVDHSNSTAMGYSNEETEAFKIEYKDAVHWKYEMSMIELNNCDKQRLIDCWLFLERTICNPLRNHSATWPIMLLLNHLIASIKQNLSLLGFLCI